MNLTLVLPYVIAALTCREGCIAAHAVSNAFGRLPGYDSASAEEAMQNRNPGSLSRHKGGTGAALPVVGVKALAPVERVKAARAVPLLVHTAVCMACPSLHTLIPLHRAAFTKTLCLNGQHALSATYASIFKAHCSAHTYWHV